MWFLCYFMHRHLGFRKPEVESLAELYIRYGCRQKRDGKCSDGVDKGSEVQHVEGGKEEGAAEGSFLPLRWRKPEGDPEDSPFSYVELPSEECARFIASRSLLVKGFFELWGEGRDYEELKAAVARYPRDRVARYQDVSFKFVVDGFGRILQLPQQIERIEQFSFLPLKGPVKLTNPDEKFWIIECAGNAAVTSSSGSRRNDSSSSNSSSRRRRDDCISSGGRDRSGSGPEPTAASSSERTGIDDGEDDAHDEALDGIDNEASCRTEAGGRRMEANEMTRSSRMEANDGMQGSKQEGLSSFESNSGGNPSEEFHLPGKRGTPTKTLELPANNGLPPNMPPRIFFARQVAVSDRTVATKYELKRRSYLGPTAMDAELALLMANQGLTRGGSLVYDPFVGTGSVLVAAAHFGSMTMGADIDIRVVRDGKGPTRNVWSNFSQYHLTAPVGLLRADNNAPPWRKGMREIFDAIICDPPYGVRAGGRKSGGRKILNEVTGPYIIPDDKREGHIPSTAQYTLEECLHDLLDMSARLLKIGGRLVFFYPAAREDYKPNDLPKHPCLKLVAASEQILTKRWSRVLLTMEKTEEYSEALEKEHSEFHERFRQNHKALLLESRQNPGGIYEAVFAPSPADAAANIHKNASLQGMCAKQDGVVKEPLDRPRYRAKNV